MDTSGRRTHNHLAQVHSLGTLEAQNCPACRLIDPLVMTWEYGVRLAILQRKLEEQRYFEDGMPVYA